MAGSDYFVDGMRRVVNGASSFSISEDFPPLGKASSSDPKTSSEIPTSSSQPSRVPVPDGVAVESTRASDGVPSRWSLLFSETAVKLNFLAPCTNDGKKSVMHYLKICF